jgi:hypothetical protein
MESFLAPFILEKWAFDSGAPSTVPDPLYIAISLVKYVRNLCDHCARRRSFPAQLLVG